MLKKLIYKSIIPTIILSSLFQLMLAYIGPGSGLTAIGSCLALFAGLVITILGFLWYPIKRILGKGSQEPQEPDHVEDKEQS